MELNKPKPKKWKDVVDELSNMIVMTEQNLVLLRAQLRAARQQL